MASKMEPRETELHFEGDPLEVLSGFPDEIKRAFGFPFGSFKSEGSRRRQRAAWLRLTLASLN
jgi:hypothetical protein